MTPSDFRVEATRGPRTESIHQVAVAVVDQDGRLRASAGDPDLVTWWRSAAKPFQAMPLVADGAADRFKLDQSDLALACASHSSEPRHLEAVGRFMAKVGIDDGDLACGVHPPLSAAVAREVVRGEAVMTPRWSNCSGKHTGMLALARHHGWPLAGYNAAGHPVQNRILDEVARWTGWERARVETAPDGCTAACFALPLRSMAQGYARLGAGVDPSLDRLAAAMMADPFLVGGTGRLCTDLMTAWPGRVIAKVGADGVYCAALPELGLGLALKVRDGDGRASVVAVLEVLRQITAHWGGSGMPAYDFASLAGHAEQAIVNTRGVVTGSVLPAGELRFLDG